MTWIEYLFVVVLVTASGALAPGPLFFATLLHGSKRGAKSGFYISIGHTSVELPLVIFLAIGLFSAGSMPVLGPALGLAGGFALLGFGFAQLLHLFKSPNEVVRTKLLDNSILLGITISALNPFFILWWFTIGSKLILDALILASLLGVFIMYLAHVWMDYVWLTFVADLAKKGTSLISTRMYKLVVAVFGMVLIYFGIGFIAGVIGISILP